jgi:GTP:adenosylcobinamide-phosphate guanylyltransferase
VAFRVFIPCAGLGTRLGTLTADRPKPLVTVGGQPAITRLFAQFPRDAEFVVALGYKGDLLREYIEFVHPELNVMFVNVERFEGPGSGLGHTVLKARDHLQVPFVFCSCDTLLDEPPPPPTFDWVATSAALSLDAYRTCLPRDGHVRRIVEKGQHQAGSLAYVGVAGVCDVPRFWEGVFAAGSDCPLEGEVAGLNALAKRRPLRVIDLGWHDVGNPAALESAERRFVPEVKANILPKSGEDIWFLNGRVVKFSSDTRFIANRVERSVLLHGFVPRIARASSHFYTYQVVEGAVYSSRATEDSFLRLLDRLKQMWFGGDRPRAASDEFVRNCELFYRNKTLDRLRSFFDDEQNPPDTFLRINGVEIPPALSLLEKVPWDIVSRGVPCRFHGDCHFENIVYSDACEFTFLDWRQDFMGSLDTGDAYYDLAKLLHGLIVSHEVVRRHGFSVRWSESDAVFEIERPSNYAALERVFDKWLTLHEFNRTRVRLICALVFLNIAPLHHQPYAKFLYLLGRTMLFECMNARNDGH